MINFRRKIGIILVVAVSAAAIMAVPASAAPKKDYFDISCQGTVPLEPSISEERMPASNYSCTADFTVKTPRYAWVEFLPSDNFTGTMLVELVQVVGTDEYSELYMVSDFVAGQPVRETVGFPLIGAGDFRLRVTAQMLTINPNWYEPEGPDSYVTVPASAGGFGGRVQSR